MGLLFSCNNPDSYPWQKLLEPQHRYECFTKPSKDKALWSKGFSLHFAKLGQDTDVIQRNISLTHETKPCCANKYRISVYPWQDIFG